MPDRPSIIDGKIFSLISLDCSWSGDDYITREIWISEVMKSVNRNCEIRAVFQYQYEGSQAKLIFTNQ